MQNTASRSAGGHSLYVYGVIPATAQSAPGLNIPAHETIGDMGIKTLCHEELAVIVSPAEPRELASLRKDELAKMLLAHQRVVERLMASSVAVIPFRLGTYAGTEIDAVEILSKGARAIRRLVGEIGGRIEMDVVATYADFASVLKEVGEEDDIRKFKETLGGAPGGVSVDDRMKVGFMVKQALDRKRLDLSRQIAEHLAAASCAQCTHENMDDKMVMNDAFLIEFAHRRPFEFALDELDARFAKTLHFRCVGPLAPYSFYTLEFKRMRWKDIDAARRLLGLGEAASAEEIKKAFQHAAQALHPDHNGQAADADR
ncbi:MAG: GvpL/GvpF family gas vesicle protein, partial [Lentisphaerae bacterium]|nr:GvpL/GvpF family gas vesicle protein [Lentisphaerota bacterium]